MASPMIERLRKEYGTGRRVPWKRLLAAAAVPFVVAGSYHLLCSSLKPEHIQRFKVHRTPVMYAVPGGSIDNTISGHTPESYKIPHMNKGRYIVDFEMKIPASVAGYVKKAIRKAEDFSLTAKERARVDRWSPLIDYLASVDYQGDGATVDPLFVKSIVAVESRGDPKACSKVYHARGLTQIRYWRAKAYIGQILEGGTDLKNIAQHVKKLGFDAKMIDRKRLEGFSPKNLFDPALNIMLACYGFDDDLKKFGPRLDLLAFEWFSGYDKVLEKGETLDHPYADQYIGRVTNQYRQFNIDRLVSLCMVEPFNIRYNNPRVPSSRDLSML